jgi:hypothetical protein
MTATVVTTDKPGQSSVYQVKVEYGTEIDVYNIDRIDISLRLVFIRDARHSIDIHMPIHRLSRSSIIIQVTFLSVGSTCIDTAR